MGLLPRMRNRAFKRAFPTLEDVKNSTEDPYQIVAQKLKEQEEHMKDGEIRYHKKDDKTQPSPSPQIAGTQPPSGAQAYVDLNESAYGGGTISALTFWIAASAAFATKYISKPQSHKQSVQSFVYRMRSHLRPGRILIRLPGGYDTYNVIHYNFRGHIDVGHTAIIAKYGPDIKLWENKDHYRGTTVGIPDYNAVVGDERIEKSWTALGTRARIGAVIGGYYKIKWSLYPPFVEFFYVSKRELSGSEMLRYANRMRGRGYCRWYEVMVAKWSAPKRFICSTLPWKAAKSCFDLNIGDWYKSTIFPAGVYLSDHVRLLSTTTELAPWLGDPDWVDYEDWDAPKRQKGNERRKRRGVDRVQAL